MAADHAQFFSTAAQVIPTIALVVVVEIRTMPWRAEPTPEQKALLARPSRWRDPRAWFLPREPSLSVHSQAVVFAVLVIVPPVLGEAVAMAALTHEKQTETEVWIVLTTIAVQLAFFVLLGAENIRKAKEFNEALRGSAERKNESRTIEARVTLSRFTR
jgi:hypothetical protein